MLINVYQINKEFVILLEIVTSIRNNVYDRITIAFGLRNITNRQLALDEIYRVLKPGGRFICLEFIK